MQISCWDNASLGYTALWTTWIPEHISFTNSDKDYTASPNFWRQNIKILKWLGGSGGCSRMWSYLSLLATKWEFLELSPFCDWKWQNNYLITNRQVRFDKNRIPKFKGSKVNVVGQRISSSIFLLISVTSSKLSQANFTSTEDELPACAADSGFDLVRRCQHGWQCAPPTLHPVDFWPHLTLSHRSLQELTEPAPVSTAGLSFHLPSLQNGTAPSTELLLKY